MTKVETKAVLRNLRVAPRKVRLLVDLARGKNAYEVITLLRHSKKHAATPVRKLIESAIANAKHNHNAKPETLKVAVAFVDGGPVLKRWKPRAFGRASMIKKRTSHITVVLEGEVDTALVAKKEAEKAAAEKKKAEAKNVAEKKATKKAAPKKTKKADDAKASKS